uniref:Protein kinase domain-containing protein n=1 Tax=Oryza brachyantha TaxID=4533 RepID=J3N6X3_ORYBR
MAAENPFGVILDEEFHLQAGQLVMNQLFNPDLEMLDEHQFIDQFNILRMLPPHDNIAPYTGYLLLENNGEQVRLVFCNRQGIRLDDGDMLYRKDIDLELLPNFGQDWPIHSMIIKGITSGLRFLHEAIPDDPIYHLDLRLSNIFSEIDMQPKIAFFGRSRLFAPDPTLNMPAAGNNGLRPYGYVAPEYHNHGIICDRSDVFGLGILILEIIIQDRFKINEEDLPIDVETIQDHVAHVRVQWSNVHQIGPRYPHLDEDGILQVMGYIAIAIECLETDHTIRPSSAQVMNMLNDGQPFDRNLMRYCVNPNGIPPGKIGYMLSARGLNPEHPDEWTWHPTPGGGGIAWFAERAELQLVTFPTQISGEIATKHLMLHTRYTVHLVYALAPDHSGLDGEHRSVIRSVPVDQVNFDAAAEEHHVRLVGGGPPAPAGPEPDVAFPIVRADDRMEIDLGWFELVPEVPGQGPHTVVAELTVMNDGGGGQGGGYGHERAHRRGHGVQARPVHPALIFSDFTSLLR